MRDDAAQRREREAPRGVRPLTGPPRRPRRRTDEQVAALTKVVLASFSDGEWCRRKTRRPLSDAALAEADRIRRHRVGDLADGDHVVVNFAAYAEQARLITGRASQQEGQS